MAKVPIVTTIPKSGTHLLWHILGLERERSRIVEMAFVEDPLAWGHWSQRMRIFPNGKAGHIYCNRWTAKMFKTGVGIFLRRHPADILLSWFHYLDKVKDDDRFNFMILQRMGIDIHKSEDKLDFLINNTVGMFEQFMGWMNEDVHKISYEDLMTKPMEVLAPIADDLGWDLDDMVERSTLRKSFTFRKGNIGDWKNEFQPHHVDRLEGELGDIVKGFGYEL